MNHQMAAKKACWSSHCCREWANDTTLLWPIVLSHRRQKVQSLLKLSAVTAHDGQRPCGWHRCCNPRLKKLVGKIAIGLLEYLLNDGVLRVSCLNENATRQCSATGSSRGEADSGADGGDATADGPTGGGESVRTRSERDAERRENHPLSDVWGDG